VGEAVCVDDAVLEREVVCVTEAVDACEAVCVWLLVATCDMVELPVLLGVTVIDGVCDRVAHV